MVEQAVMVEDVWKRYQRDGNWVLSGVTLNASSEGIFITGPNGSGKSTLLKIISGLIRPTKGRVLIYGRSPTEAKAKLGIVLHYSLLYNDLTVEENLTYYAKLYGIEPDLYENGIVEQFGLRNFLNKKAGELSFGWRKRVDIARALLHDPKVLLIDEPFTGLDEEAASTLKTVLENLVKKGITILATSPIKADFGVWGFKVLWLEGGKLREAKEPQTYT